VPAFKHPAASSPGPPNCCTPGILLLLLLQEFYETTLVALEKARNDRLWFKTQLKLVGLWFKAKEYSRMHKILKELHRWGGFGGGDTCVRWVGGRKEGREALMKRLCFPTFSLSRSLSNSHLARFSSPSGFLGHLSIGGGGGGPAPPPGGGGGEERIRSHVCTVGGEGRGNSCSKTAM
jgi:hypothetical protein